MKKPILFCLLALGMIITSCSKDENETDIQNEEVSLVGVWLWQSEEGVDLNSCEAQFTLTFDAANNVVDNQPYLISEECTDDIRNGQYSIEGSKITFTFSDTTPYEENFEIVDDLLTLTPIDDSEESITVFKKM